MPPRGRKSMGRQKIEIRRIESEERRQVTFCKRRTGWFNKASELAIRCGAEVAAVAFSPAPGGNAFAFGDPSVEAVLGRFRPSNTPEAQALAALGGGPGDRNQALAELNRELGEVRAGQEAQKARKESADEALAKERAEKLQATAWLLDTHESQMGEEDLVAFAAVLAKVRAAVPPRSAQVRQEAQLTGLTVHGGGAGFEVGGTSGRMENMHQLPMMMAALPPPPGFAETMPQGQGSGPHGFPQ